MKNLVLATLSAVLLIGCGDRGPGPESSAPLSEPEIDIWKAASVGAVDIVRQHIDYGTNINGTFVLEGVPGSGGTPLHIACLARQHEVMKLLVDSGANLNQKAADPDPFGGTPLHWAAAVGNPNAVEALLKAGANVNSTDNSSATPLDAVLFDLATMSLLDYGGLSPEKKQIYDMLHEKGARHKG